MPDSTSPFDDPFADLFGRLPDARQRRGAGDDACARRRRSANAGASRPAPGVPMSRREAREAAARQAAAKRPAGGPRRPRRSAARRRARPRRAGRA